MPSPAPRIGLLGCGLWGANILRDLTALGAKVFVADTDERARAQALGSGADSAVQHAGELNGIDAWIVATPASVHRTSFEAIAATGRPVLCEKPLATSLADARAIAARARGPVHVMDVWRYHPAVEALKGFVGSTQLGAARGLRSVRANWTSPRRDVDSAWNLLPHEISIYREIFGVMPEPRSALAELEDKQVRAMWSYWGPQAWMTSEVSNRSPVRRRELQLHCEDGVVSWSGDRPNEIEIASGAADARLEASERRPVEIDAGSALRAQLSHWLEFLAGGAPPRTDLALATQSVALVERARALAGLGT